MRFLRWIVFSLSFAAHALGQQFYRSEAIEYFNRGQYRTAIDSMLSWADRWTSERGIAYYFVGESYYNMGMGESRSDDAIGFLREAARYFDYATGQADFESVYPDVFDRAKDKKGWCAFRMAELGEDPMNQLRTAYSAFSETAVSTRDSAASKAYYMAGETGVRLAFEEWIQFLLWENPARRIESAQAIVNYLVEARRQFQSAIDTEGSSIRLEISAGIRLQDIDYLLALCFSAMQPEVFSEIDAPEKQSSPGVTIQHFLGRIDYPSTLDRAGRILKDAMEPFARYAQAVAAFHLYLTNKDGEVLYLFNSVLDSLTDHRFIADKLLLQAHKDYQYAIAAESFVRLTDTRTSLYMRAAERIPEAYYWLGWAQFLANLEESETHFQRYVRETDAVRNDPFTRVLREDAQYRIFLLQFDRNAADAGVLASLKQDIGAFQPSVPFVRDRTRLLLQLVRVGLGERIWGDILKASETSDRLKDAFILIRNMLVRASRVTGQERLPYLTYLDKLFDITQDRRPLQTNFYKGLSMFLRAEIQETAAKKREFYNNSADVLSESTGDYQYEGLYVQARSLFAAAKHESNPERTRRAYDRARPLFVRLINEAQSVRSLYYLGEILRNQGDEAAAQRCYEIVMEKTLNQPQGDFWYKNASAGLEATQELGELSMLQGIQIEEVSFPENLLIVDGIPVSLERFADPEYVRSQYWEESVDLMCRFGRPKRELYPSAFRPRQSRFLLTAQPGYHAGIRERIDNITSTLEVQVVSHRGVVQDFTVYMDDEPIQRGPNGWYRKENLPMNQAVKVRVEGRTYYPYATVHRFRQPGTDRRIIYLTKKHAFVNQGTGIGTGMALLYFPDRLDKNIILRPQGPTVTQGTILYQDMEEDISLRDFVYVEALNGYLVVHSGLKDLLLYRNDAMLSREREFGLVFPEGETFLQSPEGIAIDRSGRLYIVDWRTHRVLVFERDGTFIQSFGSFGRNQPGDVGKSIHFTYPTRIAIAEDMEGLLVNAERVYGEPQIFVADRNGVHMMDENGIYWDTVIKPGLQKRSILGLAVHGYGSDARIYVADQRSGDIEQFDAVYSGEE